MDSSSQLSDAARFRLWETAISNGAQSIQKMLDDGHDPAGFLLKSKYTPLMLTALRGDEESVRLLLPLSNPQALNARKSSALFFAAQSGNLKALEILLPVSAPNAQNASGETAIHCAVNHLVLGSIRILAPKTNLSILNKRLETPIGQALGKALANPVWSNEKALESLAWRAVAALFIWAPPLERQVVSHAVKKEASSVAGLSADFFSQLVAQEEGALVAAEISARASPPVIRRPKSL